MRTLVRDLTPPGLAHLVARLRGRPPRYTLPPLDGNVTWYRQSIPGWLDAGNIAVFEECIRTMPEGAVVEIGTFAGLSLATLNHFIAKHGRNAQLFSADPWVLDTELWFKLHGEELSMPPAARRDYIIGLFDRAIRGNAGGRLPHTIELSSDEFFERWHSGATVTDFFGQKAALGGPIAFAYIDGDHREEPSARDFANVDRHLVPGGFVLFDDTFHTSPMGRHAVARQAAGLSRYRVFSRKPNYCLQKIG